MNIKSPILKISVPLKRLKQTTIEHVIKMKHKVKRKSSTTDEKDAFLLLNLSNTVCEANKMEEPPKKKAKIEKLEDLEIIDLIEESDKKEINLKLQKEDSIMKPNLPLTGPVESKKEDKSPNENKPPPRPVKSKKEDKSPNEKETYAVTKEDYDLLVFVKSKGLTRNLLEWFTVSEPMRPINLDGNNNSMGNYTFNFDDDLSDKVISHSQENKTMMLNMMNFYKKKPKQMVKRISVSNIIEEIVNKTKCEEMNILTVHRGTQTCSDLLQDSNEKSIEKSKEMHEKKCDKKGIESLDARQSINKMPAQDIDSIVKMMKIHQLPISPIPGAPPNDQQLQNKQHSVNYPNMKMMSALEMPEHVQRMNKSWHTFYSAKGAGTEVQQRHNMMQNRPATASNAANAAMQATGFKPQHFPGTNNQVSMAVQQRRESNNLTATATSNVAQPHAYFNNTFNAVAAFNNQELPATQNMSVAGMTVAAAAMHVPAATSNFATHQQSQSFNGLDEFAPAVMRNMPAAGTQYMPAAGTQYMPAAGTQYMPAAGTQYVPTVGSNGQMEMVFNAQQQGQGYQNPDTLRKRVKSTPKFPQLSLPSPIEGNELMTGAQHRWRPAVPHQRQWQSSLQSPPLSYYPNNYPNNNVWHQ